MPKEDRKKLARIEYPGMIASRKVGGRWTKPVDKFRPTLSESLKDCDEVVLVDAITPKLLSFCGLGRDNTKVYVFSMHSLRSATVQVSHAVQGNKSYY